jgi:thiosulfate dehydrogenase
MSRLKHLLVFLVALGTIAFVLVVGVYFWRWQPPAAPAVAADVAFRPPHPEDAPADLRDAVMLGYNIMLDTPRYAAAYTGNQLTCSNCHFQGGLTKEGIPLVGVSAAYPKYRQRTKYATDLVARTNECFERSMNGKAAPVDSQEMQALQAYFAWISRGVPIYAKVPWLGVKLVQSDHVPDAAAGETVFRARCTQCHGINGQGSAQAPPLWGQQSFNDGAGMDKVEMMASFVFANMPRGMPNLTVEQALDVAAYVHSQPRPHFEAKKK